MLLCGDTPYIDTSDLATNRRRHREFLAQPGLAELIRTRPTLGTWDDHDFGANDSDATKVYRETIRQVFTEYRALQSFGENGEGIYTSFRRGPVEVFLIDGPLQDPCHWQARLRWSATEPNVFLRMVADTTGSVPTLTSTWIQRDGPRLHEPVIRLEPAAE